MEEIIARKRGDRVKLAKRVCLHYQSGNSDKVYEVDLCQIASDKYLVNFRYGRRGKSLKEGSKTIQAVSLAEAEKIFDKLITDKKKKGYQNIDDSESITVPQTNNIADIVLTSEDPRHLAIINRLAARNEDKWSLERVIWRAGELKLKNVVPLLLRLISTGKPLRDYCIAWALGKCGDKKAIPVLKTLAESKTHPEHIQRIAWEAIYQLADQKEREEMRCQKISELPVAIKDFVQNGTPDFAAALQTYLDHKDYKRYRVLDTLYQIDCEYTRPIILQIVKAAPFEPNYFKQLRHIFKMAEYRGDGEVFGILAYRFEMQPGNFENHPRWEYNQQQRRYVATKNRYYTEDLKQPNADKAYSKQTRQYLRRRVWRTLKNHGRRKRSQLCRFSHRNLTTIQRCRCGKNQAIGLSQIRQRNSFLYNQRSLLG